MVCVCLLMPRSQLTRRPADVSDFLTSAGVYRSEKNRPITLTWSHLKGARTWPLRGPGGGRPAIGRFSWMYAKFFNPRFRPVSVRYLSGTFPTFIRCSYGIRPGADRFLKIRRCPDGHPFCACRLPGEHRPESGGNLSVNMRGI